MKDLLFLLASLWMIYAGYSFGWRFLRQYGNYLLGLEWIIVATSGVNFLVWALLGADEDSFQNRVVYFFDSFSRSVGITLILVLGLMRVTHRYKPTAAVDIGVFALATAAGLHLQQFGGYDLYVGPATLYVVINLLTTMFLAYFAWRLWAIGATSLARRTALVTAAATAVAITYDFFTIPGDDEHHTLFAIVALATWGTQLCVYFFAYRALHEHNVNTGLEPTRRADSAAPSRATFSSAGEARQGARV